MRQGASVYQKALPSAASAHSTAVAISVRLKDPIPVIGTHAKMVAHVVNHPVVAMGIISVYVDQASREICARLCWIHANPTHAKMAVSVLPRNPTISANAQITFMEPTVRRLPLGLGRCPT